MSTKKNYQCNLESPAYSEKIRANSDIIFQGGDVDKSCWNLHHLLLTATVFNFIQVTNLLSERYTNTYGHI